MLVVDTTVISNFAKTGFLDLMKARLLGVKVSGTVGVLVLGVRRGIIKLEDANSILDEMIKKGFYSPIKRLEEVMPSSSP